MKTILTSSKLLIILCAMIFLLTTCKKTKYYQLTPEDLAWIVYKEGQQMKFVSDSGAVITFKAYHKSRSYTVSGSNYYEESGVSVNLDGDTTNLSGLLYIIKKEAGNTITLSWPHYYGTLYISTASTISKTIGGKFYSDIYVGNAVTWGIYSISSIYYSKTAGMVQFTTLNSVKWTKIN